MPWPWLKHCVWDGWSGLVWTRVRLWWAFSPSVAPPIFLLAIETPIFLLAIDRCTVLTTVCACLLSSQARRRTAQTKRAFSELQAEHRRGLYQQG